MEPEEENNEEGGILSVCWDCGMIAASYYNLSTLELNILQETVDLGPDYTQLRSIFRQLSPTYLVISSPSNVFLEDFLKLLESSISDCVNINKYKVKKTGTANANTSNLSIYLFDRKNQEGLRKRIYDVNIPGMINMQSSTANDRQLFINSVFPMNQELLVVALGNLLRYLSENFLKWHHIFLGLEKKLIITNVLNVILNSQVLLDDTTFNSLNIFSNIYHPSSFKLQVRKDGVSMFNLLNKCSSSIGSQELKNILRQPTHDIMELHTRFNTVEWSMKKENDENVQKIKHFLNGLVNINAVLQRIIISNGKKSDWNSFKRTVYHASRICELCASYPEETIRNTLFEELGAFCKGSFSVYGILYALDKIVDLEAIEEKKRFVVKKGYNPNLDKKHEELDDFVEKQGGMTPDSSLQKLHKSLNGFHIVYFPEVGFLIATRLKIEQLNLNVSLEENEIEIVFQTDEAVYFRTPTCKELNQKYDQQMTEIIAVEMDIFQKLISHINENFAELAEVVKICAKLDCLLSFAKVAEKYKYIRPNIVKDRKIEIINGRHPLLEQIKQYIPSTTLISEENCDFINIIRAPNSSGKSVYVKQVALICYMAHIGCFVPASGICNITQLHSIFTRIYTPDSIYNNESAFMSDLQQMSRTIMNSSDRSLILIDELGKGTYYKDGIALLTATIEHFAERGKDIVPYIFITTHYQEVHQLLKSKELISLKTIVTRKNENNIFQSTYRLVDGINEQVCTEFPESKKIIMNIFNQKEKDSELKAFNDAYNISIKAFVLVLAKMMLRKNHVTYEFIQDIYSKVAIDNFLSL